MAQWQPPDGGYGWVVLASSFFIMLLVAHPFVTLGIYLPDLLEYHETSISVLSWVGSLLLASGNFFATFLGMAIDLYGCQRIAMIGGVFTVLCAAFSAIFRYVFVLIICYGFIMGTVLLLLMSPVNISLLNYFTTKKTLVSGIAVGARSLGSLIWGPVTQWLIDEYRWHGAMLIFSALYLNTIPLAWLLKDTPIQKQEQTQIAKLSKIALLKRAVRCSEVCSLTFILYLLSSPFTAFGTMIPYMFLPTHLQHLGYSKQLSALIISVMGFTGLLARPLSGFIGDRVCVNRLVLLALTTLLSGTALTLMTYTQQYYIYCMLAVAFSIGHSSFAAVTSAVLVDIVGLSYIAHSMGIFLMFSGIGLISSVAMSGKLVDIAGEVSIVFLVAGVIQITGATLALCSYVSQRYHRKHMPADLNTT